MSLNRLVFLFLIFAYTFWINPSIPRPALISAAIFAVISIGIVVHILVKPQQSTARRIVAIVYIGEAEEVPPPRPRTPAAEKTRWLP